MQFSEVKKSAINVATLVVSAGTPTLDYLGVIHVPSNIVVAVSTIVGITGAVLHYLVPNTTTNPNVAAGQSVKLVSPSVAT